MPTRSESEIITRDPNWPGPAIPPGETLLGEFLKPLGFRQTEAAERLGISRGECCRASSPASPGRSSEHGRLGACRSVNAVGSHRTGGVSGT